MSHEPHMAVAVGLLAGPWPDLSIQALFANRGPGLSCRKAPRGQACWNKPRVSVETFGSLFRTSTCPGLPHMRTRLAKDSKSWLPCSCSPEVTQLVTAGDRRLVHDCVAPGPVFYPDVTVPPASAGGVPFAPRPTFYWLQDPGRGSPSPRTMADNPSQDPGWDPILAASGSERCPAAAGVL